MPQYSRQIAVWAVILTVYFLSALAGIRAHTSPVEMDTAAYLSAAWEIRQTGGVLAHIPNCLSGVYTEATQHPLYLLLLSFVTKPSFDAFVKAKAVTAAAGLVFVFVFWRAADRRWGWAAAAWASALLLWNATFVTLTTMVACESLLGLFWILFWLAATEGFEKPKRWLWAGLWAGLAFLTKSIAILALPVFLGAALLYERKNLPALFKKKEFYLFFAVFFLVASPLLARNAKVYGKPLYSNSSAVMWVDDWSEYSSERARTGEIGFGAYWKTHSAADAARTLIRGITVRDFKMSSDGLKPLPFWSKLDPASLRGFHSRTVGWQEFWAVGVLALFGWGLWILRSRPEGAVTLVGFGVLWVFVGWYSKIFDRTPPTRLLYPLILWMILVAARGWVDLWDRLAADWGGRAERAKRFGGVTAAALIGVTGASLWLQNDFSGGIQKSYRVDPMVQLQYLWIARSTKPGEKVLTGNFFASHLFYLGGEIRSRVEDWPITSDWAELEQKVRDGKYRWGILDGATVFNYRRVFGERFVFDLKRGVLPKAVPPSSWKRVAADPRIGDYLIFWRFEE